MIETYATSDTCPDCEAVVYDVGRYELRFCPLHAAAPELLEACQIMSAYFMMLEEATGTKHPGFYEGKAAIALATDSD